MNRRLFLARMALLLGISGCIPVTNTATTTPEVQPTLQVSTTPILTAGVATKTSPSPQAESTPANTLDSIALRTLLRSRDDNSRGVWLLQFPSKHIDKLIENDQFSYSNSLWSRDGRRIAFVRSTKVHPVISTIWIVSADGKDIQQTGPTVTETPASNGNYGLLRVIKLLAWSNRNSEVLAEFYGDLRGIYKLSLKDNTTEKFLPAKVAESLGLSDEYAFERLHVIDIDPAGQYILYSLPRSSSPDASRSWFLSSVEPTRESFELQPDATFNDSNFLDYPNSHSWSPDGQRLLIPDYDSNEDRLWIVSAKQNTWQNVVVKPYASTYPGLDHFVQVSWSPDGKWAAWWSVISYGDEGVFSVDFLDTETWQLVRRISNLRIGSLAGGLAGEWARVGPADSRLIVWDPRPGKGIYLLNPQDAKRDVLLMQSGALEAEVGVANSLLVGPWQP